MISEININLPDGVELYSAKSAAIATSFSERYFIENIRKGIIPIVRIGRSVRIRRKDLIAFLEAKIKESLGANENENAPSQIDHVEPKAFKTHHSRRTSNTNAQELKGAGGGK